MGLAKLLDDLRFKDPGAAAQKAQDAIAAADRKEMLRLVGVLGSSLRMQSLLKESGEVLRHALRLAENWEDTWAAADLRRRLAYVYANDCDFGAALELTRSALVEFTTLLDFHRVGEALTDQGQWLYHQERFTASIRSLQAGLRLLPSDERRGRFTCLLGTGMNLAAQNQVREAIRFSQRASRVGVEPALAAAADFFAAELWETKREYGRAEISYLKAAQGYRDSLYTEAAIATIKAVEMALLVGAVPRREELDMLGALVIRLQNKQAASVLARLHELASNRKLEIRHLLSAAEVMAGTRRRFRHAPALDA